MSFTIARTSENIVINLPNPIMYFYKFECKTNKKCYIGRTKNITRRITEHLTNNGSKDLLYDLVEYGRKDFDISILDVSTSEDDTLHDTIEDNYIQQYDSITNGYNIRQNLPVIANGDIVNLNYIQICAKYVFDRNNQIIFTCGELTNPVSYQILANISQYFTENNIQSAPLKKKRNFSFDYYQLKIKFQANTYQVGQMYNIDLKYVDGRFEII